MRVTAAVSVVLALLSIPDCPLSAQQDRSWFVSIRAEPTAFGSAATTDAPVVGELSDFGPAANLRGGAAVGRRFGRWEGAIAGGYGKHGLRGTDGSSAVTLEPGYTLVTITATAAYALVTTPSGARVQLFAGPSVQFWSGQALPDSRTRVGALGGVGLLAPLAGRLSLDTFASLGVASSPVDADELADLDSSYEAGALWSRELGVGLRLSF